MSVRTNEIGVPMTEEEMVAASDSLALALQNINERWVDRDLYENLLSKLTSAQRRLKQTNERYGNRN